MEALANGANWNSLSRRPAPHRSALTRPARAPGPFDRGCDRRGRGALEIFLLGQALGETIDRMLLADDHCVAGASIAKPTENLAQRLGERRDARELAWQRVYLTIRTFPLVIQLYNVYISQYKNYVYFNQTVRKLGLRDSRITGAILESGMAHISGFERDQLLLLPEAVDDYVGPDNPVRFIDAFVDGLDLVEAGFGRVQPKATGRPGYAPGDLLKLYVYGYLNRVRSSRRLEAECHRNIEVIWLLRTLKPDFKTIADFRADNRAAFKSVFRQFTLLCKRLDLFGRELLAVDGTRIKAVNNKDRNFTRNSLAKFIKAADERLADYLQRLDEGDAAEKATSGARVKNLAEKIEGLRKKRGQYDAMLKQLERTGEDQISLTDPDSRAMAAHTRVAVGYNIQVAVDAKHKLIVEQEVTNQVVDMGLLQATAEPAREILEVEKIDVVADKGYFKTEDIAACEKAGLTPYVPRPQRGSSVSNGFFRKDEFSYDPERDAYACPGGHELRPLRHGKLREMTKVDYGNPAACRDCPLRPRCTDAGYRVVSRLEHEDALDRMAARLKARPEVLDRRRETVEHPFGSIKQWMNQGAFLMRGLEKVRAEFNLTALVYNLRRALNILGMDKMMAAVAA